MATQRQLATLLIDTYGKNPSFAGKFDVRDVAMQMGVVYNDLVAADIKANGIGRIDGAYIGEPFIIDVLYDEVRAKRYFNFPVSVLKLPDDTGIKQVSPVQDEKTQLIKCRSGSTWVYNNLEAKDLNGNYGYEVEGTKGIIQDNAPEYIKAGTKLLFKCVRNGTAIDLEEEMPVPAGVLGTPIGYGVLFTQTLQRLGITQESLVKKSSDNNANTQ